MSVQLKRVGLDFDDPFVHLYPATRPTEEAGFSSIGHHGCFMSHRDVLRDAQAAGCKTILVLEDDLDFSPHFASDVSPVLEDLATQEWSHVRLGHYEQADEPGRRRVELIEPGRGFIATHCIAWRGEAIKQAADFLELVASRPPGHPDGGPMPIDGAFNTFVAQHPELEAYFAVPTLGQQRSSRSDITVSRWFDKVPVLRDLATALRGMLRRG